MADTGIKYPSNAASTGSPSWSYPTDIYSVDSSAATCSIAASSFSGGLVAYNFGLSLPSCTIDGIEVTVTAKSSISDYLSIQNNIRLGTFNGTTFTELYKNSGGNNALFATSYGNIVFGGSTNKWGGSPTQSVLNGSDFGVRFVVFNNYSSSRTAYIDAVSMKVYYTEVSGPANLKTVNGLAKASIVVINGLAIASVKSVIGVE